MLKILELFEVSVAQLGCILKLPNMFVPTFAL